MAPSTGPATGAHEVFGAIRERWAELRGERGLLGCPSAALATEIRGASPTPSAIFQHGAVEVNMATQGVLVRNTRPRRLQNYLVPLVVFRVADDGGSRPCAIAVDGGTGWTGQPGFAAAGVRFVWDGVLRELRDTGSTRLTGEGDPWWPAAAAASTGSPPRTERRRGHRFGQEAPPSAAVFPGGPTISSP